MTVYVQKFYLHGLVKLKPRSVKAEEWIDVGMNFAYEGLPAKR